MEERRFAQAVLVTWPRWPPCPYMDIAKTLKNLLRRNQKADDLETWYAALGAQVLPKFLNDDPGLTLTYFVWEKGKTMDFSETIVVYDLKLATDDRRDKKFLLINRIDLAHCSRSTSTFSPLFVVCICVRRHQLFFCIFPYVLNAVHRSVIWDTFLLIFHFGFLPKCWQIDYQTNINCLRYCLWCRPLME